jgi:hypothetical protein
MRLKARLARLEAARAAHDCRTLAGWSAEELAHFVRHAAPAALGLTAEQVTGLSDKDLAGLTADALAEELGLTPARAAEGRRVTRRRGGAGA